MKWLYMRLPALAVIVGGVITVMTMIQEVRAFDESVENAMNELFRKLILMLSPVLLLYYAAAIAGVVVLILGLLQLKRPSFTASVVAAILSFMLFNWIGFLLAFIGGVTGAIIAQREVTFEAKENVTVKVEERS